MSCRVVSYRVVQKEVERWKEVGEGRKRSQEQGARSQEPGARESAERSQDQKEKEHHPPIESYCTKQTNLHGKDEQVQGTGATAGTRAWANWGPTQSNPFR